ncbi:HNH endonuclease [Smaragdicoccus niigatensis]|uniref:HNH endonuclease n=1 Tax=Smaragdicoccus niigatensis TaxID=359359 RepID=UPI00138AAE25
MTLLKACIGCGEPSEHTRCPDCAHHADVHKKQRRAHTGFDTRQWREIAQRAIREQPYCTVCGTTEDLTADHIIPRAILGAAANDPTNVQVLCRRHNSSKGAK